MWEAQRRSGQRAAGSGAGALNQWRRGAGSQEPARGLGRGGMGSGRVGLVVFPWVSGQSPASERRRTVPPCRPSPVPDGVKPFLSVRLRWSIVRLLRPGLLGSWQVQTTICRCRKNVKLFRRDPEMFVEHD